MADAGAEDLAKEVAAAAERSEKAQHDAQVRLDAIAADRRVAQEKSASRARNPRRDRSAGEGLACQTLAGATNSTDATCGSVYRVVLQPCR